MSPTRDGARRSRTAIGFAALLWLPLLLVQLSEPYPWMDLLAASVLRRLLALSGVVWAALAVLIGVSASTVAGALRLPRRADLAAVALGSTALLLGHEHCVATVGPARVAPEALLAIGAGLAPAMAAGLLAGSRRLLRTRPSDGIIAMTALGAWVVALGVGEAGVGIPVLACTAAAGALWALRPRTASGAIASLGLALPLGLALASGVRTPVEPSAPPPTAKRSNVLLILVDTLRADHTTPGGYSRDTTPGLARLAAKHATTFTAASAASSHTVPSVASLFSSRMQALSELPPPVSMAEVFDRAGYATGAFVANGLLSESPRFALGFHDFRVMGGYTFFRRSFLLFHMLAGADRWHAFRRLAHWELHKTPAPELAELAARWGVAPRERPFFLYLHFLDPHWPYHARADHFESQGRPPAPPLSFVDLLQRRPPYPPPEEKLEEMIGRYDDEIHGVDRAIASLLGRLEASGLADDTLVIVTSDHGEEFFEHGGFSHGHDVFEEQIHVPLLIRWPPAQPATAYAPRVDAPVSLLDVLPLLVDVLELPDPKASWEGRSLVPLLQGTDPTSGPRRGVPAASSQSHIRAYREGALKVRIDEKGSAAVYDLERDPAEQTPIRTFTAEQRGLVARARERLPTAEASTAASAPPRSPSDDALERLRALGYVDE